MKKSDILEIKKLFMDVVQTGINEALHDMRNLSNNATDVENLARAELLEISKKVPNVNQDEIFKQLEVKKELDLCINFLNSLKTIARQADSKLSSLVKNQHGNLKSVDFKWLLLEIIGNVDKDVKEIINLTETDELVLFDDFNVAIKNQDPKETLNVLNQIKDHLHLPNVILHVTTPHVITDMHKKLIDTFEVPPRGIQLKNRVPHRGRRAHLFVQAMINGVEKINE